MKLKLKYAVLVLVIFLVVLTLCLKGAVPEKTYAHSEIPASSVHASIVSYDPWDGAGWSVDDFSVDIGNWCKYEQNIASTLSVNEGLLNLTGVFDYRQDHQFVILYRSLDINVSKLPIFSINISVSEGAIYHVRFVGQDANGVERDVWWETSPLDDLSGKSRWITHVVDLAVFSEQAIGSPVSTLTLVEVTLDNPPSNNGEGKKSLCISHVGFSGRILKVSRIPGDAQFVSSENPFQAVIIELPYAYKPNDWSLKWFSVTYTLTSSSKFEYGMVLLSGNNDLLQEAQGAVFVSHENEFVDIYRLDATSKVTPSYSELTLLQPLLGPSSIVIVKEEFDPSGFQMFKLDSIELVTSKENPQPVIDQEQIRYMSIGMVVAVIVVPVLLLAMAFRFREYFSKSPSVLLVAFVAYGILCRVALAPFTGHPFDMAVWTQTSRLFYESGVMTIRTFPLPFNYYLLLLGYSPYALLRVVGFQDMGFLAHNFNMLEAVFIKAPFILFDLFSFYFLFKILNRINGGKLDSSGRIYPFVYFLSSLAIVLSGVWGMYDGIAVALFLAGTYYSLFEKKPFRGAAFYVLSGLTKAFGFLGLIPIAFSLLKEKKYVQLLAMFGMVSAIVVLLYSPLLAATGLQAAPELFMQFFRGRIGLGSLSSYVASTSYMSYLSLLGFDVTSPYLTYLLIASVLLVSVYFGLKSRGAGNETYIKLTLGYFAVVFFVFYLLFFRVYEQYYLWVIPILVIYSYLTKQSGFALAALALSVVILPIGSFNIFLTGIERYWIQLNLPADTAVIAVLPSAIVALSLIGMTYSRGRLAILKTWQGMLISASLALWFSFGLTYYVYYGFLPLGVLGAVWYIVSVVIILTAAVFSFKKFRSKALVTGSLGS